jgi:tripartite-type tricarboxylate transporter receptor subunit TctC
MFKLATGMDMAHIPYSGGGPAMTSIVAGNTQISFQNLGAVIPLIRDGRLRPILITSDARSPVLPGCRRRRRPGCATSSSIPGRASAARRA